MVAVEFKCFWVFITEAESAIIVVLLPIAVEEDNIAVSTIIGGWLEGKDVSGDTVQEEAIMRHYDNGSRKGK